MSTSQPSPTPQSAAERRAAEAQLRTLIDKFAPTQRRLVTAVRRELQRRLPAAHEMVYKYRFWFVISYSPSGRGFEGVLAIRGDEDGVRLYFNHGKGLPDPEKLLSGSAQTRWIEMEGPSTLTRPAVVSLLDEAIARNRVAFVETGRGPVVIQSAPAKPSSAAKKSPSRRPGQMGGCIGHLEPLRLTVGPP